MKSAFGRWTLLIVCTWVLFLLFAAPPAMAADSSFLPVIAQADDMGEIQFDEEAAAQGIAAALAAMGAMLFVVGIVVLAIAILIYYLFYSAAASIPEEHQKVQPWLVWLMLIPCVNFVIPFIFFPNVGKGFQSYFNAQGRTDVGDCGAQLGLFYAIAIICGIIPFLNWVAGPVALVLMIILLVKFLGYKKEITQGSAPAV